MRAGLQFNTFIGGIVNRAFADLDVVSVINWRSIAGSDVEALAVVLPLARVVNGAVIKRDERST